MACSEAPIRRSVIQSDTVEHCAGSTKKAKRDAMSGGLAGALGGALGAAIASSWSAGSLPSAVHDKFELQVVGSANGLPFRFQEAFDYSDISFSGFPSESAVYRRRIERLFYALVDRLKETMGGSPPAGPSAPGAPAAPSGRPPCLQGPPSRTVYEPTGRSARG